MDRIPIAAIVRREAPDACDRLPFETTPGAIQNAVTAPNKIAGMAMTTPGTAGICHFHFMIRRRTEIDRVKSNLIPSRTE
jgi:hypothetical protein